MADIDNEDLEIIAEAQKFLRLAADAESDNRTKAVEDIKFAKLGHQWPAELQNSRQLEQRPCLTINKIDSYCRQVANQQRQQRPRIIVHGANSTTDKKVAEVVQGMIRHIEVKSNADTAYDTAFDCAIVAGWGYFRLRADYSKPDSFDQDIYIEPVENPFTVYRDPNSVLPDGSDMKRCMVTSLISKAQFNAEYPSYDDGSSFQNRGAGDLNAEWIQKEQVRVAEYYKIVERPDKLVKFSDGNVMFRSDKNFPSDTALEMVGQTIVDERDSYKCEIHWYKLTAMQVIDHRVLPGRYIPIIPVYGNIVSVDGKRHIFGLVRFAKDPQRMVNYWETAATESIALAPKAKWLIAEGQDEGHENEWAKANISAMPVLRYKNTDVDGQPAPPPQRLQPEPPPVGVLNALAVSTNNLREVLGIADPAQRINGNVSGKALLSERQQSDNATYHYYDNFTRSLQHAGRIILEWIPTYYDQEREMRILGDDGQPKVVVINQKKTTAEGEVIENNISVGEYEIVMDTGPGYNSKREQALDAMTELMKVPELAQVMGDLYFRNSDFPGSEVIADRLAAANPLSQIDENSDIPPQAQMAIKQLQEQLQQAEMQMQQTQLAIQYRGDIEEMRQKGETIREHMRTAVKAHDTETWANENIKQQEMGDATRRYDTDVDAATRILVERMKLDHVDNQSKGQE